MPLPKRVIEPVHVARGTLPDDFPLPSELEAATNGTLANIVRQLSSLSRHAEDMFGELARDAQQLYDRSNSLQARIDRLAIKVTQLDSTVEEVSLQDIHMRKAFKSAVVFDQQIFSRGTMPTAMQETYTSCDKPPPLDKLNCYRDDGKDGLKFYTDPNYFFELWRQEMLNDTERMMHDRGKKPHRPRTEGGGNQGGAGGGGVGGAAAGNRHKKRVRQPHNTRERQKQNAIGHGEYIMPSGGGGGGTPAGGGNAIYRTPQQIQQHQQQQQQQQMLTNNDDGSSSLMVDQQRPARPNSIEIRRSYQQEVPDGLVHSPTATTNAGGGGAPYPPYEENPYQHGMYGQGPMSSESLYQGGTPTRSAKMRPTQPPPAPPSNSSTPSANTPTRGRSQSTSRDVLPPPPPPPDTANATVTNNNTIVSNNLTSTSAVNASQQQQQQMSPPPPPNGIPAHLLVQQQQARSGSPPQQQSHSLINAVTNNGTASESTNLQREQQQQQQNNQDLPPPPPAPVSSTVKQASPPTTKQIPVAVQQAPPPPPPPPMPFGLTNGPTSSVNSPPLNNSAAAAAAPSPPPTNPSLAMMLNGDLARILNSSSPPKLTPMKDRQIKQLAPPIMDPRNDLLKAIRDGIKLRKVEKIEQKEVERGGNGLHDVASILARRVAVEFSDSDNSGSDSECDSEGWGETNNNNNNSNNETSA